ncbi:hypothetical protein GC163_23535 [bacterium]|nr:hypothetical protein [bacterium]
MLSRPFSPIFPGLLLAMLITSGCKPQPEITQYTIPKPESIQLPAIQPGTAADSSSTASRPERMLAAIVPQAEKLWFFKLTGAPDPVGTHVEEFRSFLASIQFGEKDEPAWQLPEGWQQQPGSGMRFATMQVGTDPALELSVIALPGGGPDLADQILSNVNRWRGQLSLPPVDEDQLKADAQEVTTADGTKATFVDYAGKTQDSQMADNMMSAPFARGMGGLGMGAPATVPEAGNTGVKAEPPEEWRTGRVGGMRKAAYEYSEGNQSVEITIIDLAAEAGERLPNVNRWRGQVGLEPVTADELAASMKSLDMGPLKGDYVELIGDVKAERPQTIMGVIVEHADKAWFIKLQGDSALALSQKANFEAFAKSVRFE